MAECRQLRVVLNCLELEIHGLADRGSKESVAVVSLLQVVEMVGLEGFEPPTHGLGSPCPTVHPVRIRNFAVSYSGSHSGPSRSFGHKDAPHNAPRAETTQPKSNGFPSSSAGLGLGAPVISISTRRLRQLDTIQLVRQQRENHRQQLAFHTGPLVRCGLPLRRPPKSLLVQARHSGRIFLHITAHPRSTFSAERLPRSR